MKAVMVVGGGLALILLTALLLVTWYEPEQPAQVPLPIVYAIGFPEKEPLSYEVSSGQSDIAWLIETREKRNNLNRFRLDYGSADEEEERLKKKKSEFWYTNIDGDIRTGYDVIKDINGEFDDYPEAPKSEKYYNAIVHYTYH